MPVPADPPIDVAPAAFRTWALDVSDTAQDHETRIDAIETAPADAMTAAEIVATFTGTPDGTTFLRDDGTLAAPSGGGGALVAIKQHNPGTKVDYSATTTSFVDADATNLAVTFTVPESGNVLVTLDGYGFTTAGTSLAWSVRDGTTDISQSFIQYDATEGPRSRSWLVTGLTPDATKTYKWGIKRAYGSGSAFLQVGAGWGPATLQIWAAP